MTKIQITQEDINKSEEDYGRYSLSEICPIAKAVQRIYPNKRVISGLHYVWVNAEQRYKHTKNSEDFMLAFGNKKSKPQEVELEEI
jgi:hypothetical protein